MLRKRSSGRTGHLTRGATDQLSGPRGRGGRGGERGGERDGGREGGRDGWMDAGDDDEGEEVAGGK